MSRKDHVVQECKHCAAPSGDEDFCCPGCRAVYDALHARGLQSWYTLRASDPAAMPVAPSLDRGAPDYLDVLQPTAHGTFCLSVDGISCAACAWLIETVAARSDDIAYARVQLTRKTVHLQLTDGGSLSRFAREIGLLGYELRPDDDAAATSSSSWDVAMAGALAANAMLMAVPSYAGLQTGGLAVAFAWIGCVLGTAALFGPGRGLMTKAWHAARLGVWTLDLPLSLGLFSGWGLSVWRLARGDLEGLYFDSLAALVLTIVGGRFLRDKVVERALRRRAGLATRLPQLVAVWRGDRFERVPPEDLRPGDLVRVDAGESLPCSLRTDADSRVDRAVVTGESEPCAVAAGEVVIAGCRAIDAPIVGHVVDVDASVPATVDAEPQGTNTDADRVATFTLLVGLAAVVGAWLHRDAGWTAMIEVATTVLLVACPCALALAPSLVHAAAVRVLGKQGVLVSNPDVLRTLGDVVVARLDKTGTLTTGKPAVTSEQWWCEPREVNQWRLVAGAIQSSSRHPIARALTTHFATPGRACTTTVDVPPQVDCVAGGGLRGQWRGRSLLMTGTPGLAAAKIKLQRDQVEAVAALVKSGATIVALACPVRQELVALVGVEDRLATGVQAAISGFSRHAVIPSIVSGDHATAVGRIASEVGLPVALAGATPSQKLALVQSAQPGTTLMFGDGRNDVPAMRAAAVAVSVAHADPQAIRVADAILTDSGVAGLATLLDVAARARKAMVAGQTWGLLYNVVGVYLAMVGNITPLLAVILMPLSSLSVIALTAGFFPHRGRSPTGVESPQPAAKLLPSPT